MEPNEPFNPLDKMNLAMSIDSALCRVEPKQLGGLQVFSGAGIYALITSVIFTAISQCRR